MPVQTTNTSYVYFPDGCKVEYSINAGVSYVDIGAIKEGTTATLEFDVNEVLTGNAGPLNRQVRNMRMTGGFTLINLNLTNVAALSGGLLTATTTAGAPFADAPNQVIASGNSELTPIALAPTTAAGLPVILGAAPTITSVTGATDGALTVNDDYTIIADSNTYSGYSIVFNLAGVTLTTMSQAITVDYGSLTPIASTTISGGESTQILTAYILRFTHTDDSSLTRVLTLFAVDLDSGGFQFNYKGANEDGTEEMPVQFRAKLDTARTSGEQLFQWSVDTGAA